ncbi:MAG TPA: LuxR C-terminal-related transcriptional regulator [Acidimicrobiia bacterium]|nr:LuxR C-terminal-related transcriptional regulator [Acidimicrobiia bacterium]
MSEDRPTNPLIATKLHVPSARRNLVARPRLLASLEGASDARLVLVSAPAGFGKTTLVAAWLRGLADDGAAVAWVSLDERDDDPAPFWTYVLAALDAAVPGLGANVREQLEHTPTEAMLAMLVNELHGLDRDVVVVLDDFHVIDHPDIHEAVTHLVDHLPERVHVVLTSRADPPLPLARLRARGELVEIRAADLRFTADEAAAYLNDAMGLALAADDIATLDARTEGWIAALQLAALSMQGRDDVGSFIAGFAGDDRYIVDYLAGEVLHRQPEPVRRFLLHTSVLDRLHGSLCDAVTGASDGKTTLEALDRENLFVIPLDDRREWYRYHHLFADVLRARLHDEDPDAPSELHRRASAWFAAHDDPMNAVRHAAAAGDFDRAAELAELALPALRRNRQDAAIRAWEALIPESVVRVRPALAVAFVGAAMSTGAFDRAEERLRDIEQWLTLTPAAQAAAGMVVADDAQLRALPGAIEMYRAALALVGGDTAATVDHAQRVLAVAPDDDELGRAAAHALLGLAAWSEGDLERAFDEYTHGIAGMRRIGHIADILGMSIAMADIRVAQGRLRDAQRLYEQGLQLVAEHGAGPLRGSADMHVGLAEIFRERDDRDAAAAELQRAQELELFGTRQYPYRSRAVRAGLLLAEGDTEGCLALLEEAERLYDTDFSPAVRPIGARRARTHVLQGDLASARAWVRERNLSTDDELRYATEFEHITLTIIRIHERTNERELHEVSTMLDRLLAAAEAGGRGSSVIEILAVQALAFDARGDTSRALDALRRALELAEPEGYARVFDYLGPRLRTLRDAIATGSTPRRASQPGLVDPLSDRELDVLRLLRSDLSGPEIARELIVSLNTMRTHTKSIYTKLGVNNRREAVRRADELGL